MANHQIRIIGGEWRGRRLTVLDHEGLRPTPDRVRETLFNWLADYIHGANCLDLFAGSGALSFEALSRGAAHVAMIDAAPSIVALLMREIARFDAAARASVHHAILPKGLPSFQMLFDIVFIDPPYASHLVLPMCFLLEQRNMLADKTFIYLEADRVIKDNELPKNWRIHRQKLAGLVYYHLAIRERGKENE